MLKPKTLPAPAELPPIVLLPAASSMPMALPRLWPLASVPKKLPRTTLFPPLGPLISRPAVELKPMTLAAPDVPPIVLFCCAISMPN